MFAFRLSDYDSVVQLGARIGAKIRDRDGEERGSLQRNKVSLLRVYLYQIINSYEIMVLLPCNWGMWVHSCRVRTSITGIVLNTSLA